MKLIAAFVAFLILTSCAQTLTQPRMLNGQPLTTCFIFCAASIQQTNIEGAKVTGAAGDVDVSKDISKEATTKGPQVAPPMNNL